MINETMEKLLQRYRWERRQEERINRSVIREPETLFYSQFSREDAMEFHSIFTSYRTYYYENPDYAPRTLMDNLERQCKYTADTGISPVEILLFSARYIQDIIRNDIESRNLNTVQAIADVLQKYLPGQPDSIRYMLCGWGWPNLMYVLLYACGLCHDDPRVMETAMKYAAQVVPPLTSDADITVLRGYIDMVVLKQDDDFLPDLARLFTLRSVRGNHTAENYLIEQMKANRYLQSRQRLLFGTLKELNISEKLRGDIFYVEGRRPASNRNPLTDESLSLDEKLNYIYDTDLSNDGMDFLRNAQDCRDKSLFSDICRRLCDDFSALPKRLQPKALIRIGTAGSESYHSEECAGYAKALMNQLHRDEEEDPSLAIPLRIAMFEYGILTKEELFADMDRVSLNSEQDGPVMAYFRWRFTPLFAIHYFSHVETVLSGCEYVDDMEDCLKNMYQVCKGVNGPHKKLGKDGNTQKAPVIDAILRIVRNTFAIRFEDFEEGIYSVLVDLLELVQESCSSRKGEIPPILDEPYKIVRTERSGWRLMQRMENLFRKCDGIIPPADDDGV